MPAAGDRVWKAFWRLDLRRGSNGYSANAVTPAEIEAWARVTGRHLRPWELDALDEMEIVRLKWLNRDREAEADRPEVSAQPVTPELVRALFSRS